MTITNNTHLMTTRSKSKEEKIPPIQISDGDDDVDDVDECGNLKGFIDYDCEDKFDHAEFDRQVARLGGNKPKKSKKKNERIKKGTSSKKLNDVFMTYLIMKATEKANKELLEKNKKTKNKKKKANLHKN